MSEWKLPGFYFDPEAMAYRMRKQFGVRAIEVAHQLALEARERGDMQLASCWSATVAMIVIQLDEEERQRDLKDRIKPPELDRDPDY